MKKKKNCHHRNSSTSPAAFPSHFFSDSHPVRVARRVGVCVCVCLVSVCACRADRLQSAGLSAQHSSLCVGQQHVLFRSRDSVSDELADGQTERRNMKEVNEAVFSPLGFQINLSGAPPSKTRLLVSFRLTVWSEGSLN